jgi:hypothetical protein
MVSFTIFKSASLLALVSTLVSAAPAAKDGCAGFHVTSPHSYFSTTAGQCYQVSYDFGATAPSKPSWVSVDLYEYKTDKFISSLVKKVTASGIATPWFNVDLGSYKKTGDYYFLVTYGTNCKPIKTPYFQVTYNKNSPPAVCPN